MKSKLLGFLYSVFLTFPGMLLRYAGMMGAVCSALALASAEKRHLPDELLLVAGIPVSAFAFAFGSAMGALSEMLGAPGKRWKGMPPRHIAITISLWTLGLLGGCSLLLGISYLARGMWWGVFGAAGCCGLFFVIGQALMDGGFPFFNKKPE